ncbi:MAG: U32 family peptidase [Limnoraphis sp. WC205]|jgi:putative protease|nr:U32 family peptidase [Limnoraphis sp. WC205]
MQFNTFVSSIADLERCVHAPNLQEVLLEPLLLARQGKLSLETVEFIASEAAKRSLHPVLVWDILMTEQMFTEICQKITQVNLNIFSAIRVCDPGAAWWVKTHFPQLKIQLIVETGNHNFEALLGWCEVLSGSLERLILSIELPEQQLIEYCQKLPVGCEILGVGRILLFYSPRSLLAQHLSVNSSEEIRYIETTVASEETQNRPFPTLETVHGTLMFLDKDQFILDQLYSLEKAGLQTVRLDLRHLSQADNVAVNIDKICQQILENPTTLKTQWPKPIRAPFFKANRTTSIFHRMKSKAKLSEYRHEIGLAEIVAVESKIAVIFYALQPFNFSQIHALILPTGEERELPEELEFRNLKGEVITKCDGEQILITNWFKKAMPGAVLLGKIENG